MSSLARFKAHTTAARVSSRHLSLSRSESASTFGWWLVFRGDRPTSSSLPPSEIVIARGRSRCDENHVASFQPLSLASLEKSKYRITNDYRTKTVAKLRLSSQITRFLERRNSRAMKRIPLFLPSYR